MVSDYEVTEWVDVDSDSWIRNINYDENLQIRVDSEAGSIFIMISGRNVGGFDQYNEELTPVKLLDCAKAIERIPKSAMKEILQICVCEYERMVKLGCALEE